MKQVNMHEAKTRLSELVQAALTGEDVVVARRGKPAVRLVPVTQIQPSEQQRPIGLHAQKLSRKSLQESMAPIDPDQFAFE